MGLHHPNKLADFTAASLIASLGSFIPLHTSDKDCEIMRSISGNSGITGLLFANGIIDIISL